MTGLKLLTALLADDRVSVISNLGRRVYDTLPTDPKLIQHVIDFENFPSALKDEKLMKQYDIAFMVHGTTRDQAGSDKAFIHIDKDYAMEFTKLCKNSLGVGTFMLMSSMGADKHSWFLYPSTKGKIEEETKALQFKRLLIFRPGMLKRNDPDRFFENLFGKIMPTVDIGKLGALMVKETLLAHETESAGDDAAPYFKLHSVNSL